jgi:uncharacterized protein YijF (DUF1287 family)
MDARVKPTGAGSAPEQGAHAQVGVTLRYDPSYVPIPFPGGDVPIDRGVCSDVIVRAFRGNGIDLPAESEQHLPLHWSFDACARLIFL